MTWFIPSRERPHRLKQLISACRDTKMSTNAVVLIDDDDPCLEGYLRLSMMPNWNIEIGRHSGLSEIYNKAFIRHPSDNWYGILCDDAVPETDYFDLRLIEVAGTDGMAIPSGSDTTGPAPHFVLGGNLVREMGWVALPGLDRLYIDTVWLRIAQARGICRFLSDVVVSHHHFSNGKAMMDKTYRKPNKIRDKEIYTEWETGGH